MNNDDFKKLNLGDRVILASCGMDSGTECKVIAAKYEGVGSPAFVLEPVDQNRNFICGNGAGTRQKIIRSSGAVKHVESVDDSGWVYL